MILLALANMVIEEITIEFHHKYWSGENVFSEKLKMQILILFAISEIGTIAEELCNRLWLKNYILYFILVAIEDAAKISSFCANFFFFGISSIVDTIPFNYWKPIEKS